MTASPSPEDSYYFDMAKEIILSHIDLENYAVFVFGSRAYRPHSRTSDIDIGLLGREKVP